MPSAARFVYLLELGLKVEVVERGNGKEVVLGSVIILYVRETSGYTLLITCIAVTAESSKVRKPPHGTKATKGDSFYNIAHRNTYSFLFLGKLVSCVVLESILHSYKSIIHRCMGYCCCIFYASRDT